VNRRAGGDRTSMRAPWARRGSTGRHGCGGGRRMRSRGSAPSGHGT